jgi:hypothetical protein
MTVRSAATVLAIAMLVGLSASLTLSPAAFADDTTSTGSGETGGDGTGGGSGTTDGDGTGGGAGGK